MNFDFFGDTWIKKIHILEGIIRNNLYMFDKCYVSDHKHSSSFSLLHNYF